MSETAPQFLSIGAIAVKVQAPPAVVERFLDRVGATPALTANGTPYYAADLVDRFVEMRLALMPARRFAGSLNPSPNRRPRPC